MFFIDSEIKRAVKVLASGGSILYPTDTIWGIGCDATSEVAVEKLLKIKGSPSPSTMAEQGRNQRKGFIVLVNGFAMLQNIAGAIPPPLADIIRSSREPVTVIFPCGQGVARNVTASDGTLAVRIAADEFCRKLITRFGKPIVSTSANISGSPYPASINEIAEIIKGQADYIVKDSGDFKTAGRPSAIIKLNGGVIEYLRR